jgi:hypothetical protein
MHASDVTSLRLYKSSLLLTTAQPVRNTICLSVTLVVVWRPGS